MGSSRRCGVLGDPIAHSLSPVLHRAGYAALGLDWEYDAHRVPSGGLGTFVADLDDSWRGLSLTMPLKREALELVDTLTDRARSAGAANTLIFDRAAGRPTVRGDNTDIPGAVAALAERGVSSIDSAAILGGGATATSVGLALVDCGAREMTLVVRDAARARETVDAISAHRGAPRVRVVELGEVSLADAAVGVLVSTIPAAAQDASLVDLWADVPTVFEAVYDPWPTPLADAALADGRRLVSGLDLLVHQAAVQFELFTDVSVPVEVLREAGERALVQRSPPTQQSG